MEKIANLFPELRASTRDQLTHFNELNGRLRALASSPAIEKLPEPWRSLAIEHLAGARTYALAGMNAAEAEKGAAGAST